MAPRRSEYATAARLLFEVRRKAIHLLAGSVALLYAAFDHRLLILFLFALLFGITLLFEIQRRQPAQRNATLVRWFKPLIRVDELHRSSGATWYFLAALLVVALFSRATAVYALVTLAVGDTLASVVGLGMGRLRIGRKTLEGTLAFLIGAVGVAVGLDAIIPEFPLPSALAAAPAATLAELLATRLNDNLTIPLTVAGVMWLVSML